MRNSVLWDSSAILAVIDETDGHHEQALKVLRGPIRKTVPFITSYIEVEAHALLLARVGRTMAREWLTRGAMHVVRPTPDEEAAARQLVVQHTDKDWSLCDALSFVVIESRGARGAFAFDRHFRERNRFEVFGPK